MKAPTTEMPAQPLPQPVKPRESTLTNVSEQIAAKLDSLDKRTATNQAEIQKIEPANNEIKNSLVTITTQLNTVNHSLATISQQLQQLTEQLKPPVRKVSRRMVPIRPRTTYYVKAVIPGRAWLQDNRGNTTTVSQGDTVPGYGTVLSINPQTGTLETSSGFYIQYKPN
jgi:intracellular multiplication protein IcmG